MKNIAIIGFGGFGEFLYRSWEKMPNANIVAICDSKRKTPDGVNSYVTPEDLLQDKSIDIVAVATPPNTHKQIAIMSLDAGKHVLLEKPPALTVLDAEEINATAERNRKVVCVDFVLRYNPIVGILLKIIRSDILGRLRYISFTNYAASDELPEEHWFWDKAVSGGIFTEHGVHFFDLAHLITGSAEKNVCALAGSRKKGIEDRVSALVEYEDGSIASFYHSFSRPRILERAAWHLAFDLGEIKINGWIPLSIEIDGMTNTEGIDLLEELHLDIELTHKLITDSQELVSSGIAYKPTHTFIASALLKKNKNEVYAENLRAIMADMIKHIDSSDHRMRTNFEDAIEALATAQRANDSLLSI